MDAKERVDLAAERLRVEEHWRAEQAAHVPLPLAASFAFLELNGKAVAEELLTRSQLGTALEIVAMALSRLIPIYARQDSAKDWIAISVDPTRHRFQDGARAIRAEDGGVINDLSVKRVDVLSAIPIIERAGLAFYGPLPVSLNQQSKDS